MFIVFLIINIVFVMVSAYFIYYFLKLNYCLKVNNTCLITFIILFGLINGLISTLWINFAPDNIQNLRSILLLILSPIIIKLLLKVSIIQSIISFCVITLLMALGNFSLPLLFYIFGINATPAVINSNAILFTTVNLFISIIVFILINIFPYAKKIGQIKNINPIAFLLVITFLIIASNLGIHYVTYFDFRSFLMVLISSIIYLCASIFYIIKYQSYELKLEEQKQQSFYNESLGNALQDLRHYRHDQANHLAVISSMLKYHKYNDAEQYLNEIVSAADAMKNTAIFNIQNAGLFAILSTKIDKANNCGINVDLRVIGIINSIDSIKISELCEIIGIYLDNAIEAAQDSNEKNLSLTIINSESSLLISIANSCKIIPNISLIKTDGYSTKGNNRGHGLAIVDKILNKYKNVLNQMNFEEMNMEFKQSLQIKKGI